MSMKVFFLRQKSSAKKQIRIITNGNKVLIVDGGYKSELRSNF